MPSPHPPFFTAVHSLLVTPNNTLFIGLTAPSAACTSVMPSSSSSSSEASLDSVRRKAVMRVCGWGLPLCSDSTVSERKPQAADQTKGGGINGSAGAAPREGEGAGAGATSAHFEAGELLSLGRWKNGVETPSKPPHSLAVNVESAPAPPAGGGLHMRLGVAFAVVAFAAMALSRCH